MDVRGKGFSKHIRVSDALNKYFGHFDLNFKGKEVISLKGSVNRVLAEDVVSDRDIPHFDRAAMDGYAVRAEDTFGASMDNPFILSIKNKVEIGDTNPGRISKGQAIRIATGAAMPEGSDAVVMIEYTQELADSVEIYKTVTPAENVSLAGEDVSSGDAILKKNTVLKPQDVGMLAAVGMKEVSVRRKPVVAVLSTGNELIEPEDVGVLDKGKVIDVNRYSVISALKMVGAEVLDCGICRDSREEIKEALTYAVQKADMVVASGGTSVGEKDLLPEMVSELGEIVVHGVSTKPGMPVALCHIDGKPVVLLPGFPVAAMVAFYNFVPSILEKMLDACIWERKYVKAKVGRRIPSREGVRTFTRVTIHKSEDGYVAHPIRTSGSGILSSMVKAHGFAIIPEDSEGVEKDEEVEVLLLRNIGCSYEA